MNAEQLLTKAQTKIADPKNWIRGTYAQNAAGAPVAPGAKDAICWCSLGAIESFFSDPAIKHQLVREARDILYNAVTEVVGSDVGVAEINDNEDWAHSEIMKIWDKARELAHA